MKEKLKLNTFQIIFLCIAIALTAYGVFETIRHIGADVPVSKTILICLSYILILYYALFGYKVPHGNLLKYIMLFFALLLVNEIALEAGGKYPNLASETILLPTTITGICVIIISYISGRLHKFNRNIYLFALTLILLIARAFLMSNYRTIMFSNFSDVIIWLDINCAYALRFKQHKQAGLESE